MRRITLSLCSILCCCLMSSCGAVIFGSSDPNSAEQPTTSETETETETETASQENSVDCDSFMQQLADNCYSVTAFDADGTTPLHMFDENGNDLGEVDQEWAANYCECYAQLAFQTFGCSTVISHEELDDATYATTYQPIIESCSAPTTEDAAPAAVDAAPAAVDAAPAAVDAAPAAVDAAPAAIETAPAAVDAAPAAVDAAPVPDTPAN